MKLDELLAALTAERYEILKRSVELGKWPDGRPLTTDEKESSLQVLIAWDLHHKPEDERIGFIPKPVKTACEDDHDHGQGDSSNTDNLIARQRH